jgi:drug/metabolite transporter (DMT)-like permease
MNGKLIQNHDATVISFYEFIAGCFYLFFFLYENKFTADFFVLSFNNWALMLLASFVRHMLLRLRESDEKLSPYTVMLTTNLEPVYGIILAYFIGGKEMSFSVGAVIIIITVILNGIIKHKAGKK